MPIALPPIVPPPVTPGGLGEKIVKTLIYGIERSYQSIAQGISNTIQDAATGVMESLEREALRALAPAFDYLDSLPGMPPFVRRIIAETRTGTAQIQLPIAMLLGVGATIGAMIGVFGPVSRAGGYLADRVIKSGRMDLREVAVAARRGILPWDRLYNNLADAGLSEDHQAAILDQVRAYLDPGILVNLFYRKVISNEELRGYLGQLGYNGVDVDRIIAGSPVIPPLTDLIRMAVREVFTPAIAARFGQFEDYPEILTDWANKQGLSREHAINYWAAHWELPSISQGYEMLHRGVITAEDLDLLMRSADVMPFWRDKLKATSYAPYTRVDVRRMYKAHVITKAEVLKTYMDLGYDAEHAAKLTEWTIAENTAEEKDLTKTELVQAYVTGVMTREELALALREMGYDDADAAIILSLADIRRAKQTKAPEKTLTQAQLVAAYQAGQLTASDLRVSLSSLGYDRTETELLVKLADDRLRNLHAEPNRNLAQSSMATMYERGLVKREDYVSALSEMGYDPQEVELLAMLSDFKVDQKRLDEDMDLLRVMYVNRHISESDLYAKLASLGLPDTAIQRYMYLWTIEQSKRIVRPTQAQLTSFLKAGVIGDTQYVGELLELGYSRPYAQMFLNYIAATTKR